MTESQWINALIILLIVIPVFSWASAIILAIIAAQRPYSTSLLERTFSAVCKAIGSTMIAVIALGSLLPIFDITRAQRIGLLAGGLVMLEIPAVAWLLLYASRRFRGDDDVA